jgi:UDPglucose 6-dehydrogenase
MIGVIGLGFVGLTTALGFAEKKYNVYCYDKDQGRQNMITSGIIPFHEPFLAEITTRHLNRNLTVMDSLEDVIQRADLLFYCVGTPSRDDGRADLTILTDAVKESIHVIKQLKIKEPKTIIIKSTVPPSTCHDVLKPLIEGVGFKVGTDIYLADNPEFLREGYAWKDFINPDRIVIGADDPQSGIMVKNIYKHLMPPFF